MKQSGCKVLSLQLQQAVRAKIDTGLFLTQFHAQGTPPVIANVASGTGLTLPTNISPVAIITITGSNLAQGDANLSDITGHQLPTTMGGVQVTIGAVTAPLFMVSATTITAQVPFEISLVRSRL